LKSAGIDRLPSIRSVTVLAAASEPGQLMIDGIHRVVVRRQDSAVTAT
jgi:hypothetical protein